MRTFDVIVQNLNRESHSYQIRIKRIQPDISENLFISEREGSSELMNDVFEERKKKHIEKLVEGVDAWNKWREENPEIIPYLPGLKNYNPPSKLIGINFENAILLYANLSGLILSEANFNNAKLEGSNFTGAHCEKAEFNAATLYMASFEEAFLDEAEFISTKMEYANLSGSRLYWTNFNKAELSYSNFSKANLYKVNFKSAELKHTNFEKSSVSEIIYDRHGKYKGINIETSYGSPMFKRFAQDQDYLEEFREKKLITYWIWFVLADCGRSLVLWAGWSILFAFFFAWKFYNFGPHAFTLTSLPWNFETMLYYSIVTFTTLGFGDVTPDSNEVARWVMAEVITGYIMLGGLISIFATKLARRS